MFLDNEEEIFNQWNNVKKRTQEKIVTAYFREREIYWANLGKNIGYEQQLEKVAFFYNFNFLDDKTSSALLVQAKTFDVKRLDRKIGTINMDDFEKLELKFKKLMKF